MPICNGASSLPPNHSTYHLSCAILEHAEVNGGLLHQRMSTQYYTISSRACTNRIKDESVPTAASVARQIAARALGVSLALRAFGAMAERQKSLNLCWARSA
jgi:hypothetical protein